MVGCPKEGRVFIKVAAVYKDYYVKESELNVQCGDIIPLSFYEAPSSQSYGRVNRGILIMVVVVQTVQTDDIRAPCSTPGRCCP